MTHAGAAGAAGTATVVTGPPLPDHLALALALREATAADDRVVLAERALEATRAQIADAVKSSQELLAERKAEARAAGEAVNRLLGDSGGTAALEQLKAAAAAAMAEYEAAAARLAGEGGGK